MISIIEARDPSQLDEVRRLLRAFVDWQRLRYSSEMHLIDEYFGAAYEAEIAALPGDYALPRGRLLLAYHDAEPVGCVALRDLGDGVCEMKRLYVYADRHGENVGRTLGTAIVDAARRMGYRTMRLDTGYRQVEAQTLYRSLGFSNIDAYYPVPDALRDWLVFMELDLQHLEDTVDESLQESFPASDSPAVFVTDEPPVNAQAKWDAAAAEARRLGLKTPTRR